MSTMNGVVLKHMTYNGQKVKKWDHNGVRVFNAGSTVTYICNGVSRVEEFDEGASVLTPKTFSPTLSGATFKGWSKSPSSTTVETSLTMGSEPITLYAVFKYDDLVIYNSSVSGAPFSRTTTVNNTTYVTIGDITSADSTGNPETGGGTASVVGGTAYTLKSAVFNNHTSISVVMAALTYSDYGEADVTFNNQQLQNNGDVNDLYNPRYITVTPGLSTTAMNQQAYAKCNSSNTNWFATASICVQKLTLTGGKTVVG